MIKKIKQSSKKTLPQYLKDSYEVICDSLSDLAFSIDKEGDIVYLNQATAKALGKPKAAIVGKPLKSFFPSKIAKKQAANVAKVFKTGKPFFTEDSTILNNVEVLLATTLSPVKDGDGKVILVAGVSHDITTRNLTKQSLMKSEEKMLVWLENSPACTKVLDLDFNLHFMSHAGIAGLQVDDVSKRYNKPYPFDFFPKATQDLLQKALKKAKKTGEKSSQDLLAYDTKGNDVWFLQNIIPIKDKNGKVEYIIIVSIDTTEYHKVLGQAHRLQDELLLQQERMPFGLIVWDSDFKVKTWNPAAAAIFGYTEKEALGMHSYDIIVPKSVRTTADKIWAKLIKGNKTVHSTNENITKDKKTIVCKWANTPLVKDDGTSAGVLSMVQDVTDGVEAERELNKRVQQMEFMAKQHLKRHKEMMTLEKEVKKLRGKNPSIGF